MSYLDGPRINFWGGVKINVDTTNNTEQDLFDMVSAEVTSSKSDAEIIEYLRQPAVNEQGEPYYTHASWNYYGDHQVAFENAKISSSGAPGAVSTEGDLTGLPVYLLGSVDPQSGDGPYGGPVMVDLDPTSSQTTRIYVGGIQIGDSSNPALLARHNMPCHSHFLGLRYDTSTTAPPHLTPGSAWANGTFQLAFPKEAIQQWDESSPILQAILSAPNAVGFVVRFSLFECMPGMATPALQESYRTNRNQDNPSLGRVIGTIGPWYEGEPDSVPPGRLLQNTGLGGAQGLAHLDADNRRLTLDLVSALQGKAIRQDAFDITSPIGPNVDYGTLTVTTSAGSTAATFPSLPDTYYLYGGVYDVEVDPGSIADLQAGEITLSGDKHPLTLQESRYRIFGDPRNIYVPVSGHQMSLPLIVRELGGPVRSDVEVQLSSGPSGELPDPGFLDFPGTLTAKAGTDTLTIPVATGTEAGFAALNLAITGSAGYFVNFRKYPDDDFSSVIEKGDIPWDLVYENCLRYFYVIFPAMSRRIPLNDEPTMKAVSGEVLKRISTPYRPTTLYMPLTRALSPGKIALLQAWLEEQQGG